jgi:hypothetical protein
MWMADMIAIALIAHYTSICRMANIAKFGGRVLMPLPLMLITHKRTLRMTHY